MRSNDAQKRMAAVVKMKSGHHQRFRQQLDRNMFVENRKRGTQDILSKNFTVKPGLINRKKVTEK